MKVFDLLEKIKNRQEIPCKICIGNFEFGKLSDNSDYMLKNAKSGLDTILHVLSAEYFLDELLDEDVEVIQDKIGEN